MVSALLLRTDRSDLVDAFSGAQPGWVIAGFLCYALSMVVASVRWTMLARPLGFKQRYSQFFGSYFTGMYMNLFAPSTVAGDVGRALYIAGGPGRRALAFTTIFADRGLGFVVLVFVGAVATLLQPGYALPAPLFYGAWIVPPATLLGWLYGPQLVVRVFDRDSRWRTMVEKDLEPYWRDYRLLLETSVVAGLFHCMQIGSQVLLARALGLKVPWPYFLIFVPAVNIAGMAPVSFSGIGIREYGYVYFLGRVTVERHAAVALGLLASGVVLLSGLVGGLVYLFWNDPQLPRATPAAVQVVEEE
ncbi:MAG: flippase-like domain-containing protein [Deltaproteobacteria bacterium]|nr:flippase-like domain-containing protein [Deltaproteobacteria bacterium]